LTCTSIQRKHRKRIAIEHPTLNNPHRVFGLIGYPLSHSFSKRYFDQKFIDEKIAGASFENFELADIGGLEAVLKTKFLCGLAVTIPYKKEVLPWLTEADPVVTAIHACNCIRVRDSRLHGYNTDVTGFERSFVGQLGSRHTHALILGTGGAAVAVAFALDRLGIQYRFVSRSRQPGGLLYEELDRELLEEHTVIINASPAGTLAHAQEAPDIPYQFLTPEHYLFDLVYNPPETIFLKKGKEKGASVRNGYDMLALQAEENWKIWNQ